LIAAALTTAGQPKSSFVAEMASRAIPTSNVFAGHSVEVSGLVEVNTAIPQVVNG